VLIFALATVGGILVVGVGGGMIRPMQSRWEQWLTRAQAEVATAPPGSAPTQEAPWERNQPPGSDTPTPADGFPKPE
jgi:hypothetical protein